MIRVNHPFKPIYNKDSIVLILGSFPSIKSREINFYYGHPQNRFWKILENIYNEKIENNTESKIKFLIRNNIALWDIVKECDIVSSSDSSIKNAIPNDINMVVKESNIKAIFCNGNTSYKLFMKYFKDNFKGIDIICLPSSSPANAKFSLQALTNIWKNEFKNINLL